MSEIHVGGEAIHAAVRARDAGKLRALLAAGGDPNALDASGQPPLRYVLTYGAGFMLEEETCAMITALLAAGADSSVSGVATALMADARAMVCSAGEAGAAAELEEMLAKGHRGTPCS
jgi:ankyrin repeat protein